MHAVNFWPTEAVLTREECKESVNTGKLCSPMNVNCFGIRIDDLKFDFHKNYRIGFYFEMKITIKTSADDVPLPTFASVF